MVGFGMSEIAENWQSPEGWIAYTAAQRAHLEARAGVARRTVKVRVLRASHYGCGGPVPEKLSDAISWLQDHLRSIPKACRASAKFEIESEGGYEGEHHVGVSITYERPETDAEWAERRADMERRQALATEAREAAERAEFQRLAAKFGTAP